jgi:hypothetical protein
MFRPLDFFPETSVLHGPNRLPIPCKIVELSGIPTWKHRFLAIETHSVSLVQISPRKHCVSEWFSVKIVEIEHRNTGDSSSFREAVDGGGRIHVPNPREGVPKRAYRVLLDMKKR